VDHRLDVPLVPKSAITRDEEQTFVFVPEGDKVRRVRVELGLQDAERVEILTGVAAGDPVIVAGHTGLKDGAKIVRVDLQGRPEAGEPAAEAPAAEAPAAEAAKTDAREG